jgi:hypothetical protein
MPRHRFRAVFLVVWCLTLVGALGGAASLITGLGAPPVGWLEPLGLTSWVLPGLWLLASVAVPSAVVVALAWRRSRWTPTAVLAASALLAVELLVQIPFVGLSVLQAVFGLVAVGMAVLAAIARDSWRAGDR